jgi:co-chaperonin GroES (HSP10)
MNLVPHNRHILVSVCEDTQEEENNLIVLPSDYEKPKSPYVVCDVLDVADDCETNIKQTQRVIAERRMLHTIEVEEQEFHLILENYIYGRINED